MAIEMKVGAHLADLTNKIALITGASSGLGAAMAKAFVAAGAYVVNADITLTHRKATALLLSSTKSFQRTLSRLALLAPPSLRPMLPKVKVSRLPWPSQSKSMAAWTSWSTTQA